MRSGWNRLLAALTAVLLCISISTAGCAQAKISSGSVSSAETAASETTETSERSEITDSSPGISEDGTYFSAEDVSLYLYTYHHLPSNFITKKEARALGWEGGPLESYAPGKAIGGDVFGNYEGTLPEDHTYHECDIDTEGKSRGAKRLVWSEDWTIYYTEDHYDTFTQLYP